MMNLFETYFDVLCILFYRNRPILKTLGQYENLGFVIVSTRENIRLIARASFRQRMRFWSLSYMR